MSNGFNEVFVNSTTGQELKPEDYAPSSPKAPFQGNLTFQTESGKMTQNGPSAISTHDYAGPRTPGGVPTSVIKDDTIVQVQGMQTTAQVAASLGFLQRTSDGTYVQPGSNAPVNQQESQPQQSTETAQETTQEDQPQEEVPLSQEAQEYIQGVYDYMGQDNAESLANTVINSLGDSEKLESFALKHGYSPESVQNTANKVVGHLQGQAESYLSKKSGQSGQEIMDWAIRTFDMESWQETMRIQWNGSMAGYDAILKEYRRQNPHLTSNPN